ncbi:MAG: hypothetical protein M1816_003688 [Peltula sp. TS41687]|nr:MAG: hypothetical protein M1816_003688 [Peltula sp. TS41687]
MDNLSNASWVSGSKATGKGQPSKSQMSAPYPALQPSSSSRSVQSSRLGQNPVNGRPMGLNPANHSSASSKDSFSNLISFGSNKSGNNLSLLEKQRQLTEEKSRRESEQKERSKLQFNTWENQFWDDLGQTKTTSKESTGHTAPLHPSVSALRNTGSTHHDSGGRSAQRFTAANDEDDLLSAFSATAPVDSSTHFPPPSVGSDNMMPEPPRKAYATKIRNGASTHTDDDILGGDASDPFGLGSSDSKFPTSGSENTAEDEVDFLGLLGKPVNATFSTRSAELTPVPASVNATSDVDEAGPEQKAVSELVEMGFSAEKAREALATTETGMDVQAAVGWLLDAAHREAKDRQNSQKSTRRDTPRTDATNMDELSNMDRVKPAWMHQNSRSGSSQNRSDHRSPKRGEKDITLVASDIGSNLLKSANNIWKTGKKRVQKTVDELQYDSDPSQPKWMREVRRHEITQEGATGSDHGTNAGHKGAISHSKSNTEMPERRDSPSVVTEEVLMLESDAFRPHPRQQLPPRGRSMTPAAVTDLGMINPASIRNSIRLEDEITRSRNSSASSKASTQQMSYPRRLNKATTEEESTQAYISPARRKAPVQKPATFQPTSKAPDPEHKVTSAQSDTYSTSVRPGRLQEKPPQSISVSSITTSLPVRPAPPTRVIPPTSAAALSSSASHRAHGSEAFKKGDYTAAETAYTRALSALPSDHPAAILILCNRSLVHLKNGDPKAAISDAERALAIIGPSRGEGEKIKLGGSSSEDDKEMRPFFAKALIRKAESLEQMEKWKDGADAWRQAVETGLGGAISIQGRDRCEKAAAGSDGTRSQTPARQQQHQQGRVSATKSTAGGKPPRPRGPQVVVASTSKPSQAVERLRQANEEAEKADDEKFALADSVDARVEAWRSGKQDNIRALLVSLDTVLWPEAGWKKVGMHELVMANKVKISYMKGIAKVHPDKIPVTATTEQRMIGGAVFGILNEAWEKFRVENHL